MERVSSSDEFIVSKVLREDICRLFICRNIVEFDLFELQSLANIMIVTFNMFEMTILDRV